MPSTEQIVNDIKAILNQVDSNTSATAQTAGQIKGDTQAIENDLASLLGVTQAGFVSLSQGIATLIDLGNESISLQKINNEQNRVVLCWLETIANLECEQLRRLDRQIEIQESIDSSTANVRDVLQLVHAEEALVVQRDRELAARIEECCPPERPEPEPCFEPCRSKEPKPYKRKISSYDPIAADENDPR
jgi:hypothetical protein